MVVDATDGGGELASCAEHSYKNKSYSFQLPATSFQLPATSYQLSASSYQLPASFTEHIHRYSRLEQAPPDGPVFDRCIEGVSVLGFRKKKTNEKLKNQRHQISIHITVKIGDTKFESTEKRRTNLEKFVNHKRGETNFRIWEISGFGNIFSLKEEEEVWRSYARYIGNTDSDTDIQYRQAASFFEEICTETSLSHATPNLLNRQHPVSRRLRATDHWQSNLTSPLIDGSMTAPKIKYAVGSTRSYMTSVVVFTYKGD
ncbi:hypothetical protein LXL04_001252 [Taraxacum kok-saghyz]